MTEQLLAELSGIQSQIFELQQREQALLKSLKEVVDVGEVVMHPESGRVARWKLGRKSTDYEAAAMEVGVQDEVIAQHTKVKETVAWKDVAKTAKIPKAILEAHTTQAPPTFVVEFME